LQNNALWTEKYRPSDFSEIKGQREIVKRVKAFVEQQNLPHLMFAGPAGVGKTSLSLVIAKKLFGDLWRQNFLELNASDERGIDIIRNKVKDFARTRAIGNVPFKIIYLDECLDFDTVVEAKINDSIIHMKLGDLVDRKDNKNAEVASILENGRKEFVKVSRFLSLSHDPIHGFYEITIHDKKLKATGNHLLLTQEGWKRVDQLKEQDLVLCPLPSENHQLMTNQEMVIDFELIGLPQEIRKKERYIEKSAEKKVIEVIASHGTLSYIQIVEKTGLSKSKLSSILSENSNKEYVSLPSLGIVNRNQKKMEFSLSVDRDIAIQRFKDAKRRQNKKNLSYVMAKLSSLDLYPLKKKKALIFARILGHLFSDGSLVLKNRTAFFSGQLEDMQIIKQEIVSLGFKCTSIKRTTWKNGECWSFNAFDIAFISLLYSLGCPVGRKTDNYFMLPDWLLRADKEIKKEFIAAFFGGEAIKPMFQGRTPKPILVSQSKREDLLQNLNLYLEQWKFLLEEFELNVNKKILPNIKSVRKDGTCTREGYIWIKNNRKNLINFLGKVGYRYCKYKEVIAKEALAYLHWKETLGKGNYKYRPIIYFNEWKVKHYLGDSAFFYVQKIEKIKDPDRVYCLTTENGRFVANGIVVHNCDALTREAQQALRRTMENYTQTCRFILSCNYSSKIIEPIQSRCVVFRFKQLDKKDIMEIIENIAKDEKLKIDEKAKEALVEISEGDCRRLENILQSCAAISNHITEDFVHSMASVAKPKEIREVLELALSNKFIEARNKLLDLMLSYGLAGIDVIKQIQKEILELSIDNKSKMLLIEKCGETEFRMTEGSDEFVQLEALLSQFALAGIKALQPSA